MFKRSQFIMLILSLFLAIMPRAALAVSNQAVINKSLLDKGIITVSYIGEQDRNAIVRIAKGEVSYDYNLEEGAQYPLQLGNGDYTVLVAEAASGNKYRVIAQEKIALTMEAEEEVFLQSIPLIDWNLQTKAAAAAKELTSSAKTDEEKVAAIYGFITTNFRYDYDKEMTVEPGYVPNLDEVYESQKGICYDYAATFAAMARSAGLPTKLVMGYQADVPGVYHAWNQVFFKKNNEWVTIDTTFDAARIQHGKAAEVYKDTADYRTVKVY